MGRQLGRCKKCNCQATIDERDSGICIWCAVRKLENEDISWLLAERDRLAAEHNEVITKLLDLTAPHVDDFGNRQWWQYKRPEQMHARACEIAGRTE